MKKGIRKTALHFLTGSNFASLPVLLSILLYLLIYLLRSQQGGWEPNLDLFPSLRQSLDQRIATILPSPQAELLSGILLGNKKDLPAGLKLNLRDTSTLHIVVVSGENLTLLASFIMQMAGLFKRKTALVLSIVLIIFYTILTGGQVPVLRAAIMVILTFTAQFFGRPRDGLRMLLLTGGAMLLLNPAWLTDLSFQLSFLATFGVVVVSPFLVRILNFLPEIIKEDLAVTTSAQLMVMPILIQSFHQLSIVSIPTNLLIGWTISFSMILGILMLICSYIFMPLAQLMGFLVNILLTYFVYIVHFFSLLPFAWEYVGEQVWVVWVGYYFIIAGLLSFLGKHGSPPSRG